MKPILNGEPMLPVTPVFYTQCRPPSKIGCAVPIPYVCTKASCMKPPASLPVSDAPAFDSANGFEILLAVFLASIFK